MHKTTLPYLLLAFVLILWNKTATAQVINIQNSLSVPIEKGWDFQMDISQSQLRGNIDSDNIYANLTTTVRGNRNLLFLMVKRDYGTYEGELSTDSIYTHLRYNFFINKRWRWELFAQADADEFKRNKGRQIYGTGPRYMLRMGDSLTFATSLAYLVETERFLPFEEPFVDPATGIEVDGQVVRYIDRDRNTPRYEAMGYLSYAITPGATLAFTVNSQPAVAEAANYKALYEIALQFYHNDNISFSCTYQHLHNSLPPYGVQRIDTSLENSLVLNYHWNFGDKPKRRDGE